MEPIVVLVGFMGAGKTTLLKWLTQKFLDDGWQPRIILNDYENAQLDSQQFLSLLNPSEVKALSGSCICCSGVKELRDKINETPRRDKGITIIEANGTTDAVTLMEFLGVGINPNFLPPVQISVVDCRNWQKRGNYNDLESHQVQVSSLIFLNHIDSVSKDELNVVKSNVSELNPSAQFRDWDNFDLEEVATLTPSENIAKTLEHLKSHWSSCSYPLPDPLPSIRLQAILDGLPEDILRVKGCTKLDDDDYYTYFEKIPADPEAMIKPYRGDLVSGPTILVVGPGSDPVLLKNLVENQN